MSTTEEARQIEQPLRVVDGVAVYIHEITPTQAHREAYDTWWNGVLLRRLTKVNDLRQ